MPYKLITGNYLSVEAGIFLFSAIIAVLIALLWRFCVRKYMPNANFAFVMLGFLTLLFGCGLFAMVRGPAFHNIALTSGVMFSLAGVLLLFKSIENEKTNYTYLFFACLCLALVVGCRPNLVVVSLLVPFFLWDRRSLKLLAIVAIPYIIVAIPLCIYNYVRFGSITEFGLVYTNAAISGNVEGTMNPLAYIVRIGKSTLLHLFQINKYSIEFPFVENIRFIRWMSPPNIFFHNLAGSGIINFPIVFCLFYMIKDIFSNNRIEILKKLSGFLVVPAAIIILYGVVGVHLSGRYAIETMPFLIFASLFSAWYWCNCQKSELTPKLRFKVVYVLCAATIFVGLCLFVSGNIGVPSDSPHHFDPVLYRYLEESFGIIKR